MSACLRTCMYVRVCNYVCLYVCVYVSLGINNTNISFGGRALCLRGVSNSSRDVVLSGKDVDTPVLRFEDSEPPTAVIEGRIE